MDKETREQLWKDPDWICPKCRYANLAIRQSCRNCGTRLDGEVLVISVQLLEVV